MRLSLLVFVFFLVPQLVCGWWDTGHMLVAQIAWKHLSHDPTASPATLSALENAVNALVSYSSSSDTFVTAACWMDDEKTRGVSQFSNWHFVNLPICNFPDSNDTDACNGTSVTDVLNSDEEDVIWAITSAITTIRSKTALGFERGFAVRNLLHLVGDLHQPLHAVARFAPETPNGDAGGNGFTITGVSFTKNLHGFWDSGLGMLNNSITRPLNDSASSYLSNLADAIIEKTQSVTNETYYNITQWALESREIAMQYVYNLSFDSTPSEEYISQGWAIAEQQLGKAGYRLHLVLKQITPCAGANCPDLRAPPAPDSRAVPVVIALAIILGVSVLVNLGFTYSWYRRKSRGYTEYNEAVPLARN